ncbi:MAG: chorismate synthase [Nitrospirae bacterium]|nr:chorismate synthase [Nitrospirota bacterium]MCL5238388.1 chorismate synthase [Nitrospirota bacterium]
MLRFLTAGESHGRGLVGILEGIPSGLPLSSEDIDRELKRRQMGHGRGGRMKIEQDRAVIMSGVRWGKTIGSPVSLLIENRDWKNWQEGMSPESSHNGSIPPVTRPRPGHADLAGILKYGHKDIRNILERSSARETAMKVAVGAVAKRFLSEFGIAIGSYVIQIGNAKFQMTGDRGRNTGVKKSKPGNNSSPVTRYSLLFKKAEKSPVRCPDEGATKQMVRLIDKAAQDGDTLGGVFEVTVTGVPAGLGSHIQWDRKLDARLAQAVMGIQAIKGVEIGTGFAMAGKFGSEVMDEIFYDRSRFTVHGSPFYRESNHAGGIEGGISNGMPVVIRAAMKPIPTLRKPLRSVDIISKEPVEAAYERSDTCAVPAASVIAEAMAALVIADLFLEKFGGDTIGESRRNFDSYLEHIRDF